MTVVVVNGTKTVTHVHWDMLDAKRIMMKSITLILALCLMMTCFRFIMAAVFQYVLTMNVLCWKPTRKMIPVELLFLYNYFLRSDILLYHFIVRYFSRKRG